MTSRSRISNSPQAVLLRLTSQHSTLLSERLCDSRVLAAPAPGMRFTQPLGDKFALPSPYCCLEFKRNVPGFFIGLVWIGLAKIMSSNLEVRRGGLGSGVYGASM